MAQQLVREVAHRLFANEFNQSRVVIEGEGEKDPNFVISPLGAKVNRVHAVGVCMSVEPVGESGDVWRARVSDPTGVFTVYAGQYQPEAAQVLSNLETPAFVAVTGKARTYEPEEGSVFVSIRPETVTVVDEKTRDQWNLDASRATKERVEAAGQEGDNARRMQEHYPGQDPGRFRTTLVETVQALSRGEAPMAELQESSGESESPTWTPPSEPQGGSGEEESSEEQDALDDAVLAAVRSLEGDDGASWDGIVDNSTGDNVTPDDVEEALNRLMDKGLIYEPTLGVLKST